MEGSGFSIAAPENVVSVGGASVVAGSYEIGDDGTERLTFEVPEDAPLGESPLLVIVGNRPSNSLDFTVTP